MIPNDIYKKLHALEKAEPSPDYIAPPVHMQPGSNTYLAHISYNDPRMVEIRMQVLEMELDSEYGPGTRALFELDADTEKPVLRPGRINADAIDKLRHIHGRDYGTMAIKLRMPKDLFMARVEDQVPFTLNELRRLAQFIGVRPEALLITDDLDGVAIRPWDITRMEKLESQRAKEGASV